MAVLLLTVILAIVAYIMCSKNNFKIRDKKNYLYFVLNMTLALFLFLSFYYFWFFYIFIVFLIAAGILVMKKNEEYVSLFSLKVENIILILSALSIIGVLSADISLMYKSNQPLFSLIFLFSGFLAVTSRLGFTALCSFIAQKKKRSVYFGFWGFFLGLIGVIITCMVREK